MTMTFDDQPTMLRCVIADEAQRLNPARAAVALTEVHAAYWQELIRTPRYTDWPDGKPADPVATT